MQAYIQEIQTKQTSVGPMYDLVMSDGNRVGAGKFRPKGVDQGDYVNYDIVMRGQYMNLAPGSLSKAPAPAGVAAPAANAAPAQSRPAYQSNDKRQEVISKQAALNTALTFVNLLSSNEALPLTKSVKADKKADIIEEIVMRYTAKFYNMATGETYDIPEVGIDPSDLGAAEADGSWDE